MPRTARKIIFEESKFCHILVQGIAKEYLFDTAKEKNFYLKCLSEKKGEYKISILSFCIMGNHAHLLLTAENVESLSLFLKKVNTTYAKFFNKKNKRVGFVFRNRYRAEPIKDEKNLLNCISYIHNNPVKANLVGVAEDYEFSSAKNYLERAGIIDLKRIEGIFGEIPKSELVERDFIDEAPTEEFDEVLNEIIKRLNIKTENIPDKMLAEIAIELKQRTGTSLRDIANRMEVGRERLRIAVSSFTSP